MKQFIEDTKLLLKTDKRFWGAGGFIVFVLVFWSLTSSWRPLPEVFEEKVMKIEVAPKTNAGPLLEGLHESLTSLTASNDTLKKDITRVSRNLETKQEEIDWNVDQLVSRLSNMSHTLDSITKKVGSREVKKMEIEQRMANRSKAGKRK